MTPQTQFCHNPECPTGGQVGQGNIGVHSQVQQRYRCKCCGHTFTPTQGAPVYRLRTAGKVVTVVLTLLTFADTDLEKLYVFARLLRRYLPSERAELPREIQQNVDMDSYRIQPVHRGTIRLEHGAGPLDPQRSKDQHILAADAIEPLSQIIHDLNERFGTDFSAEDRVVIAHLVQKLTGDPALATSVQVNTPENARLTFDHVVTDHLQDMVDTTFKFYKRVTDDQAFARFFLDWLFDQVQAHLKSDE